MRSRRAVVGVGARAGSNGAGGILASLISTERGAGMKRFDLRSAPLLLLALCVSVVFNGHAVQAADGAPLRVDVIFWFDTEDYLLPADDDACKRLADMLTKKDVRATFKVVGEKARVLEKRGRSDVIEA